MPGSSKLILQLPWRHLTPTPTNRHQGNMHVPQGLDLGLAGNPAQVSQVCHADSS